MDSPPSNGDYTQDNKDMKAYMRALWGPPKIWGSGKKQKLWEPLVLSFVFGFLRLGSRVGGIKLCT